MEIIIQLPYQVLFDSNNPFHYLTNYYFKLTLIPYRSVKAKFQKTVLLSVKNVKHCEKVFQLVLLVSFKKLLQLVIDIFGTFLQYYKMTIFFEISGNCSYFCIFVINIFKNAAEILNAVFLL